MHPDSAPTRGRTLDHAAPVYDLVEPLLMLGRQGEYNRLIVELLELDPGHRVLDLGCGTGVLTRRVGDRLDPARGGLAVGIDAAAAMVAIARKRRAGPSTRFEVVAAEALPFVGESFDAVISSLFFHHVDQELKAAAFREAFRVLRPGGKLVVADMHTPTTWTGALVSYTARWLFTQPEIGENIRGVLPELMRQAGFPAPRLVATYFGYIATFVTRKPLEARV
jgi:ubiquinone/menaquinone biosynthesis C-methylase UbiE